MIKKYESFLKEANESADEIDDFIRCLRNCRANYDNLSQFQNSYSRTAQYRTDVEFDPKKDFEIVNNYMETCGWNLERCKKLASEVKNFISIIERRAGLCAPIDYYLYIITKKQFALQGYSWDGIEEEEYMIRFRYGWHRTSYGRLIINQNMGSISNFLSASKEGMADAIISYVYTNMGYNMRMNDIHEIKEIDKMRSCYIPDGNDIYVDSHELLLLIKKEMSQSHLHNNSFMGVDTRIQNMSQTEFDDILVSVMSLLGMEPRVLAEGDIKSTIS